MKNIENSYEAVEKRLREISSEMVELSRAFTVLYSSGNRTPSNKKGQNFQANTYSHKPIIEKTVNSLKRLITEQGLLGIYIDSPIPSITVSSTVAFGLKSVGASDAALMLINKINNCQDKSGNDRGVFYPPLPSGGHRTNHNYGNFWALYSNLFIAPECAAEPIIIDTIRMFLDEQNDGSWGFTKIHKPKPYFTANILLALLKFFEVTAETPNVRPDKLASGIKQGIQYLLKCGNLEHLIWGEHLPASTNDFNLPTTLAAIQCLCEFQSLFHETIFSPSSLDVAYHSFIKPKFEMLMELEATPPWAELRENEAPTFYKWLSVPDVTVALLSVGISPWDSAIIKSLKWIENHIADENRFSGIDVGIPHKGKLIVWVTGQALNAIGIWEARISNCFYSEEFIHELIDNDKNLENLNSLLYAQKVNKLEKSKNYYRKLAFYSVSISALIGAIIFINFCFQNIKIINAQWVYFSRIIDQIASNEVVNFLLAFLGFLPLVYATYKEIRSRFSKDRK